MINDKKQEYLKKILDNTKVFKSTVVICRIRNDDDTGQSRDKGRVELSSA